MSRHKDLFDALWEYLRHSKDPEMTPQRAAADTNELIDDYRAEVLREVVAKQRQALKDYCSWRDDAVGWPKELEEWVIDPIDPDKEPPS